MRTGGAGLAVRLGATLPDSQVGWGNEDAFAFVGQNRPMSYYRSFHWGPIAEVRHQKKVADTGMVLVYADAVAGSPALYSSP